MFLWTSEIHGEMLRWKCKMAVKSGWSLIWPHSSQALCEDSEVYGEVLLVQDSDIMNGFLVRLVSCMTPKSCNTVINARH